MDGMDISMRRNEEAPVTDIMELRYYRHTREGKGSKVGMVWT